MEDAAGRVLGGLGKPWPYEEQHKMLVDLLRPSLGVSHGRQMATALMKRFGSLPAALAADRQAVESMSGMGPRSAATMALAFRLAQRLAAERVPLNGPLLASKSELVDYLHLAHAFDPVERFRILFLDKRNRLIADEVQQVGTVDHSPVYPREVIKRTLELSASAIILVHNHPSGDPSPSAADVKMTREIASAAAVLGITVHDHLIIGRQGHVSMRGAGLLGR